MVKIAVSKEKATDLLQKLGHSHAKLGRFTTPGLKLCKCKIEVYKTPTGNYVIDRDWCDNHYNEMVKLQNE